MITHGMTVQKSEREGESADADAEGHERACRQPLLGDAVEDRGQKDEKEARDFTDGRDVAEHGPFEMQHVLEVVGDYGLVGVEGQAEGGRHHRKHDVAAFDRRPPRVQQALQAGPSAGCP